MNHIYRVIFNASQGLWVVVSEFATGRKKTKSAKTRRVCALLAATGLGMVSPALAADCTSTTLPFAAGATQGVYECYLSGAIEDADNDGKIDNINRTDTANYQNKNQAFNSDTVFSLSNDMQWLPDPNGPKTPLSQGTIDAFDAYVKGALTVKDSNGNTPPILPKIHDWDLDAAGSKSQITWLKSDGTQGVADVYDTDSIQTVKDINTDSGFFATIITAQPTQPFIGLTLASINNGGNLNLVSNGEAKAEGFTIDWYLGQVKQSSLFIAQQGGTINQSADTAIRVTFDTTDGINNPNNATPSNGTFGPDKELSGGTISFHGNDFVINSKAGLDAYNNALIAAIKNNSLAASDYDTLFRQAFKDGTDKYTWTYDPGKVDYTEFYVTPEMSASVGKRAIFEATGSGIVNLNANVAAIGQTWARAFNVWAHNDGTVNNNGTVTVNNANTQNALIESGSHFINKGTLHFATPGTNWADQVTGSGSSYENQGVITVTSSSKNSPNTAHPNPYYKLSRNLATEVNDRATAINRGSYFIGTREPSGKSGTATGVHINNGGNFTNYGNMTIGTDADGEAVTLKGGSSAETLNVDESYNAVSAWVNNSGNPIHLLNDMTGIININSSAKNSVAMNLGEDPTLKATTGSTFSPQYVTVENNGTLNVQGSNSAGLKAAGSFTTANHDAIVNKGIINVSGAGSSGIFAASGAEITNNGSVVVTGNDGLKQRAYGIRADNATVTLDGNSNLTVKGSHSTGLYARTGGKIIVHGGSIAVPKDPTASNQVVFWVSGKNAENRSSLIEFASPTRYTLENDNSTLFRIDQGATYDGTSSNLNAVDVNGKGSIGYSIASKGTTFDSGGTTITVSGQNATGLNVNSGAGTDGKVHLSNDTQINVTGKRATIATIDGNTYDLLGMKTGQDGAKLITEAALSTGGTSGQVADNAIGYKITNQGELEQNGTIDFSHASNTTGVYIDGGTLTNHGAIASNGIGIDVYQTGKDTSTVNNTHDIKAVDGTAAIRLNKNATLAVGGNGTIIGQNAADAIRVMSGANLEANGAKIAVEGSGSGIHFLNTATDAAGSTFHLSGSGLIAVSGNNAAGITLEGQDAASNPTMSNANLDTRGSENLNITVTQQGGNGIVTHTSGYVYSGTSVNIQSPQGQSALLVKGKTQDVQQTGNLQSGSTAAAVVDLSQLTSPDSALKFSNSGTISANGGTAAVDAENHHGNITFKNTGNGAITGDVKLGNGNNRITINQNSSATSVLSGDGSNQVDLQDNSQTQNLALGNGGNSINIHGGTTNGTLTSGNGNDAFNLLGVNSNNATPEQSHNAFGLIDGGAGADILTAAGNSWYRLADASQIKNIEKLHVTDDSVFEVHNIDLQLNDEGGDSNIVRVDNGSTYFINHDAAIHDYHLQQRIKGDGTIRTDTHGHAFDFSNADYTRDNFTGTLALGNGTLSILGDNTTALTHATLQLDNKGIATLHQGEPTQMIGGLAFNSGMLVVEEGFIGAKEDALQSHLEVTDLDATGSGSVRIVADGFDNDYNSQQQLRDVSHMSLLQQDEGKPLVAIVKATGSIIGKAAGIAANLVDKNGNPLPGSENKLQDIRQRGEDVAEGTYGIGTTTGADNDGLYASYLLKQIDIRDGKTLDLVTSPGDRPSGLDLSVKLTGQGNAAIQAYGDYLSLSNRNNDFTGSTTVQHGTLILGDNNVLGQENSHTNALNVKANTLVTFGKTSQYVGSLNSDAGGYITLDSGALDIANGGELKGQLLSAQNAKMYVNGGILNVMDANSAYHGATTIAAPATTSIHHLAGLGDGAITLSGVLNVVATQAGNLINALSGDGSANIVQGSDANLTGNNSDFSGRFMLDANSTLRASQAQHLGSAAIHNEGELRLTQDQAATWTVHNHIQGNGDVYKLGSGTLALSQAAAKYSGQTYLTQGSLIAGKKDAPVNMATSSLNITQGAQFAGYGSVSGDVDNQGTFNVGGMDKASLTNATHYRVNGNFTNSGNVIMGSSTGTGSTLSVGGNWISSGGTLQMNTVLNGGFADTQTDQLLVSGNARLGNDGATHLLIKNIGGQGAFTQPDAIKVVDVKGQSDQNTFVLGQPTVIGIYEYRLSKGLYDDSWYLSSYDPAYPPDENKNTDDPHYVNPIIGGFAANQQALGMFNMTLHDRLGEPQYAESLHDGDDLSRSMWLRVIGSHQHYNAIGGQLSQSGHSSVMQLGHDIINWSDDNTWRGRMGIMAGVGNQQTSSKSKRTGSKAHGNVDSAYSVGLYGTLYQNDENPLGTYIDTWAMYNWYRNTVSMSGYSDAKYDSRGINLSVEAGHTLVFNQADDKQSEWQFQPQAQLTWGRLSSDGTVSDSGLSNKKNTALSLESRLGTRLTYVKQLSHDRQIQPFAEMNWHHEFHNNSMTFNDRYSFDTSAPKNRYELKAGFEAKQHENFNGWANVSYSVGDDHYREPKFMVGIKYQW
ncbi:autotransporter outer membrane beta-barrel domain-containing protein [Serratia liquefaciens]|uniref:autotransporter outer membrane beta-barrel domain-containing protein n=1 Tax=Serratia liquefaciens TaxID=614 RepID=UPI0007234493|nr:autotransporter outer membrane beta-barrel domain-containing protein [Serratia liquefaciens]GAK25054.1 hypothetical protein SLIQ_00130 [Serratia liquefaciens FK01]